MQTNHVVCLNWGKKYGPNYVNRLFHAVKNHLSLPHQFWCLTEDATGLNKDIGILPLHESSLEYAWNKLVFFQPGLGQLLGTALYFDLDVVITDSINCLFEHRPHETFLSVMDWNRPEWPQFNASVLRFELSSHNDIWNDFKNAVDSHVLIKAREWDGYLRSLDKVVYWDGDLRYGGDQEWISIRYFDPQSLNNHSYPQDWILSYKRQSGTLPPDCKVMVFHGYPKPHEVSDHYVISHWQSLSTT